MIFLKFAVGELTSPRLDWPRVGLSASCPVSGSPTYYVLLKSVTKHVPHSSETTEKHDNKYLRSVYRLWLFFTIHLQDIGDSFHYRKITKCTNLFQLEILFTFSQTKNIYTIIIGKYYIDAC